MSDRAQSAKIPFRVKSPEPMNKPERVQSPKPQPLQRQLKSPEPPPPSRGSIKSPEPPPPSRGSIKSPEPPPPSRGSIKSPEPAPPSRGSIKSPEPSRFPVRNADSPKTPERFKSPEPAQTSPQPVLNGDNNSFSTSNGAHNTPDTAPSSFSSQQESAEDQGLSRKKVVRVVKKVVRRVVPTEEESAAAVKELHKRTSATEKPKPAEPVSKPERTPLFSFKHDGIKKEPAKDDMAAGLASLMSRAKTKEHRARFRGPERRQGEQEASPEPQQQEQTAEPQEEEKPQRKAEPTAEKEKEELSVAPPPPKTEDKLSPSSPRPCPSNPQSPFPAVLAASKPEVKAVPRVTLAAAVKPLSPSAVAERPLAESDQLEPVACASARTQGMVDEVPATALQAPSAASTTAQHQVKTEEEIAAEQEWYGTDKVWLVHKDGFSLATLLKAENHSLPEGKVKIKLEHDGTILDVDEDDVEKANPPAFDRVEDLASLQYLNESSVMHSLRQRYGGNLLHTYAGPSMVIINPLSAPSMYSEKVMHMFKGCRREDSSPHIYAVAQAAYRNLLTTRQDQSIVLLGKSGSGKTTNSQHLVQYLVSIAGSTGKIFSAEKWQAVYTILEAFGNSATGMNSNGSRFSQIVSLDFDQAGQVASASLQTMLLEKLRVTRRPDAEASFNVFYYMMAGADSTLRTELHFNHFAENSAFGIAPLSKPDEKQKASQQFTKLQAAMKVLGIASEEQRAIWLVLGAIYHLGAAGATKVSVVDGFAGRRQFARHEWAQKAAYLLGSTLEALSSAIFKHQPKGSLQRSNSFRQGLDDMGQGDGSGPKVTALECLEAMASGLYSELFTLLISLINRALKSSQHSLCSIMVVDTPGFQNPRTARQDRGATFEELCHNYTQERLQTLFHERTFVQELERYKEENIELALDDLESSTSLSVAAVDQASHQALVRSLARNDEARGLLWLMEEEALQPGGSEETLLDRLFTYYGPHEGGDKKGQNPLMKSDKPHHFLLGHSHATDWVEYDARGWLSHAKQNPASQNAATLLQDSQKKNISCLFMGRAGSATVLSGSIAGLEGSSQLVLRRATSMRKTFTTGVAAVKKKSLCIQIKLQVDALIDTVKKSKLHFVHCLLPKADALSSDMRLSSGGPSPKAGEGEPHGENCDSGLMQLDVSLLRAQLRGSKLLDALRIYRQGYPDHMVFSEFRRRFDVLAPHLTKKHGRNYIVTDEKRAAEELLESLDLENSSYHMGLSRVFFRAGTLAKLEEQRDEQTRRNISLFQGVCRGYMARQSFKKRKIQDLAIRCIQKNIKKNKGVKGWPWWKLFTTVRPLIEVQLSEEQIRGKDEEIQQLRGKLEKVEKERNELRLNTDRLECRITEISSELADERNTGESASQLLESETSERLRLEKEMKDLQAKFDTVKKQMDSMEMEVMEARLMRAAELNGELDDDDDDSGGEWRLKYDRAIREIDFTKKRLQQEFDDKLEVEQQNKRQLERRLTDLQADSEESQRTVQQLKKKCQRLTSELQDTKLHLEGQQGRNHELEKKQRKFDSELSQAQDEAQREKFQKEILSREKDVLTGEVFSLRQQLEDKDSEISALNHKVELLEVELQDLSSQESKDEASLSKVKKQLRDLEAKAKDQEEELDEQAGTIQMLEQAKLRLEMELERLRQSQSKEMESKDEEVEEVRQSCQKKLKQMEAQLEEEYDDKQKVLREKRDLESKLSAASEQVTQHDLETEKRLRKDLKRTKALLVDAQIMLDHLKNNAPSKREIAQLKNQLEESEFTCAAAVKSRKSMEVEIEDMHIQMDDISKTKSALEEQVSRLQREKNELQSRLEEDQEDMNELMKKHKTVVAQSSRDLAQINDLQGQLEEASKEKQEIQEKLQSLQSQLEFVEQSMVDKSLVSRQEAKIRELETKLEFERTQVKRLESLANRLKENMEKLTEERDQRGASENREREQNKRLQRQIRDIKEEMGELAKKEMEASRKKHELEMDIESLEAANQSLQVDLKLAFKRIGDLQAAIEDEMESDDNEDVINSLQDMVTKYQKRKTKTEGDSETDSEVEERVDGVKSWLSKNKGSSKTLSDDGSLKSSRYALNVDAKEGKELKEGKEWKESNKEGKEVEESRPVSVMSSLSYRKRSNLKDSIGGKGDESSLFSALKERSDSPDRSFRKSKRSATATDNQDNDANSVSSWKKSQIGDDLDDRGSVISQAYSEATSRARKGLDRRWSIVSPDLDKESTVSVPLSRVSSRRGLDVDDDSKSSISFALASPVSSRRSMSRLDDSRSDVFGPASPSVSRRSEFRSHSPTAGSRADSRLSLSKSRMSEFDDDSMSIAFSETRSSAYSPHSVGRSFSVPPRPRTAGSDDTQADSTDVKPVAHRNYLDPALEAAINEVLNYKPIKFKRQSLEPDSEEVEEDKQDDEDDKKSVRSMTSLQLAGESRASSSSNLRRSVSAMDCSRPLSSCSTRSSRSSRRGKKKSRSSRSQSSSEDERRKKGSKKKSKKTKKKSKRKETDSESESSSESSSSSSSSSGGSTISYRSSSSIKKGPRKRVSGSEEEGPEADNNVGDKPVSKKDEKKRKKKVDSLVMKYLYRPESD
ncbi:unconventional myosin-XVIIIa-like isoform X8 [Acipenser ruthenus]|uniref:unconventional myosin-XVIIIa-like isoform X8 n=1 Tax=Acipenser ruthenus TaxID=7906 RepID=UPI00274197A2|nr:unconventional myosin-XVIIIa-like isoform X8 [Acipenser ruthenus]